MSPVDVYMLVVAKRLFEYSDTFEVFIEIQAHAVLYKAHISLFHGNTFLDYLFKESSLAMAIPLMKRLHETKIIACVSRFPFRFYCLGALLTSSGSDPGAIYYFSVLSSSWTLIWFSLYFTAQTICLLMTCQKSVLLSQTPVSWLFVRKDYLKGSYECVRHKMNLIGNIGLYLN